ncbi:hypothetical protein [Bacillus alkalisoli]|uniref:hypothetical protein n=1 Tax=Bacillus alkalisoli TaxID=2011008 RepID=UPI0012FE8BDD|nr:hypothetical protein [Bacillus alkalisoli]
MDTGQALAYTTIAMERLGYSKEQIENVTNEMLKELRIFHANTAENIADKILYEE